MWLSFKMQQNQKKLEKKLCKIVFWTGLIYLIMSDNGPSGHVQ